ncbi:MAG: chemotaxis protein CheW [Candidatus Riflebacteria bacterium]|nr:chemotaxis protein CheW [Candidatus Riflebacteria bacterium]
MSVSAISKTTQYLTFKLGEEIFGVDVAQVREILDFTTVTKVPQTPEFMRGVINLRGSVVPVVDMRLKFGMSKTEKSVNTCIVVVEVALEHDTLIIGALADSVQEVIELEPTQIEPPPKIGNRLKVEFLKGMGKRDEHFIMILDIDKVFSASEISVVQQTTTSGSGVNLEGMKENPTDKTEKGE